MRAVWLDVPEWFLEERRRLGWDKKDELWDGVLHMVPPLSSAHQRRVADLFAALAAIAKRLGLEIWGDATGIYGGDNNWRIPDVTLARPEHVSERGLESAVLVVEMLSPNDESRDKLAFYARVGVREVWIIDPHSRAFEIYALGADGYAQVPILAGAAISPALGVTLAVVDGPRLRLTDGTDHADI